MLLKPNPGLRCRNVGQLGFCGRGVFVFGSAFVLCIKVIGSPSAASANPIKHLPASFPSRLQLEKFSAQMHLSHRRSHLCPKRLIALDANCNFGQRRLGPGKTIQSSPVLAIMPGRFLLITTNREIGWVEQSSNVHFSSQSDKTALLLARWPDWQVDSKLDLHICSYISTSRQWLSICFVTFCSPFVCFQLGSF